MKFQISRLMGFKVGIFRISPIAYDRSCDHQRRWYLVMRIDMIHRRVRCTGFVKLYAALSIGSAESLALAGGRSHDANPNKHAFVQCINIHGNHKCL